MTETIVGAILVLGFVVALALRIRHVRHDHDVRFGPHLHDRVMAIFDSVEAASLDDDEMRTLELHAQQCFDDVLTGVGLVASGWRVRVQSDEVLGPMPHLVGPDGSVFTLAEFEVRLRDGRIELEAA